MEYGSQCVASRRPSVGGASSASPSYLWRWITLSHVTSRASLAIASRKRNPQHSCRGYYAESLLFGSTSGASSAY